jgi:hypothetical protein
MSCKSLEATEVPTVGRGAVQGRRGEGQTTDGEGGVVTTDSGGKHGGSGNSGNDEMTRQGAKAGHTRS